MSLGKAIQKLDPRTDSNTESRKANNEAQQDLKNVKSYFVVIHMKTDPQGKVHGALRRARTPPPDRQHS